MVCFAMEILFTLQTVATAKDSGIVAGIANDCKKMYGVQFHPEVRWLLGRTCLQSDVSEQLANTFVFLKVDLTVDGMKMIKNFLYKVCGFEGSFTINNRKADAIREIQETVGDKKVLCLVSG